MTVNRYEYDWLKRFFLHVMNNSEYDKQRILHELKTALLWDKDNCDRTQDEIKMAILANSTKLENGKHIVDREGLLQELGITEEQLWSPDEKAK